MELNYLRVFYQVAKDGKFAESAKKLNISQSALSRSVSLLEESEGIVLFDRSKTGVTLTPKGTEVFRLCEKLFQTEKEIENICRGVQEKVEGLLHFAASDHLINEFLPKEIAKFRKEFPLVVPSIRSGTGDEIVNHLLTTDCEFGLMFIKVNTPQIEYQRLHSERMSLVCSPTIWKECRSSSHEKTLRNVIEKYGYISSIGAAMSKRSSQVLTELFGGLPPVGLEVNSQESQKKFCMAGVGVAYLANFMVKKEISEGDLVEIPMDDIHEFHLWLARPKGKFLSLTSRTFIKQLAPQLSL